MIHCHSPLHLYLLLIDLHLLGTLLIRGSVIHQPRVTAHRIGGAFTARAPVATPARCVFATSAYRGGTVSLFEDRGKAIVGKHKWGHNHLMVPLVVSVPVIAIVFSSCRTFETVLPARLTLGIAAG